MVRVLVVEDSPTTRELLVAMLGGDSGLRVVATASAGEEAVALTRALRPDVVTMDIHLPGIDGLEATRRIMVEAPTPIVIVSGTVDPADVRASVRALSTGALAVLPRPPGPWSPDFATARANLVSTVRSMAEVKVVRRRDERAGAGPLARPGAEPPARGVAVAASTGGPAALVRLLGALPADFPAPMLVVQHIAEDFVAGFAGWLDTAVPLRVTLARDGEPLVPAVVYVAPARRHLGIGRGVVRLSTAPPIDGFRPSATWLYRSAAAEWGSGAVGIVLTGMGSDGVDGLRAIHEAGGRVIAQDERTSVVFGMPGAAVAAGVAHAVLPLDDVAARLCAMAACSSGAG